MSRVPRPAIGRIGEVGLGWLRTVGTPADDQGVPCSALEAPVAADPVLAGYLDYARQCGLAEETTIYHRRRSLERLQAALGVPLLEATPAMLAAWRAALTVSDQVVLNYVCDVQRFYSWCVLAGLLPTNPAAGLPVPRKGFRLPRPIAEDELFTAIAGAPGRIRPMIVLAAYGGLRCKEIAYLRRECVLDTARPPRLLIAHDATKGRRERSVPLVPYALAELRRAGLPASGWVFRRGDGRPGPNHPQRISHLVNDYLHACGIDATIHQARHWFGTEALGLTQNIRVVQELMGHASPASTAVYTLVSQAAAADVLAGLPVPPRLRVAG